MTSSASGSTPRRSSCTFSSSTFISTFISTLSSTLSSSPRGKRIPHHSCVLMVHFLGLFQSGTKDKHQLSGPILRRPFASSPRVSSLRRRASSLRRFNCSSSRRSRMSLLRSNGSSGAEGIGMALGLVTVPGLVLPTGRQGWLPRGRREHIPACKGPCQN